MGRLVAVGIAPNGKLTLAIASMLQLALAGVLSLLRNEVVLDERTRRVWLRALGHVVTRGSRERRGGRERAVEGRSCLR